jgi:HK97 family phage major capsid protein
MTLAELKQLRAKKVEAARAIAEGVKAANRAFTTEENTQFDNLMNEATGLREQIDGCERADRLATLEAEVRGAGGNPLGLPLQGGDGSSLLPHQDPNNVGTRHQYKIMKALRQYDSQFRQRGAGLDGLELEVHQELLKRKLADRGSEPKGILIPWDLSVNQQAATRGQAIARRFASMGPQWRALDTTAGAGSIPVILDLTLIELLRNRLVVQRMGATVMSDMQGLFAIPRQSGAGTLYWNAEGTAPTGSQQTIDQVPFVPKTAGAFTDYTRRFLEQTNQDAEMFVRNDLTKIIAIGVDLAAINGLGQSNQPLGIMQNSAVTTVTIGANGGKPTWAMCVGLETQVAIKNADEGRLGYITGASLRGSLKQTLKTGTTFPVYLWNADAPQTPINGYPCGITNNIPTNLTKGSGSALTALLFGNWEDLIICFWSGVDIIIDPFSLSTSGGTRFVALQDCDINTRHPESFAKCVDIDPT